VGWYATLMFRLDRVGTLKALVEKWCPQNCTTEKNYETSLAELLRQELPEGIKITPQHSQGRFRADLVIDDRLIVEIKYNLDSTDKYHRLVGQIITYKDWPGKVILILTGQADPDLKNELYSRLKKEGLLDSVWDDKVIVIEK
jgi:hypothetical protein